MDVMTYSDMRARLKEVMDRVSQDHSPVLITRQGGESCVIMSLSDYQSLDETAYLLSSPENARRLRESIAQLDAGLGVEHDLIEP